MVRRDKDQTVAALARMAVDEYRRVERQERLEMVRRALLHKQIEQAEHERFGMP